METTERTKEQEGQLDEMNDAQLMDIFSFGGTCTHEEAKFSVNQFRSGNRLHRSVVADALFGVLPMEDSECPECNGDGVFQVASAGHTKQVANGEIVSSLDIVRDSLTVCCPSCRLGQWLVDKQMTGKHYRRAMFKLGSMDGEWMRAFEVHAVEVTNARAHECQPSAPDNDDHIQQEFV